MEINSKNEETVKEFELNTKILQNFDEIMSMKLDEIETLKITELDNGSKVLNIISLCANLKNLIVDGNLRMNTDKIIRNIFKPDKLEKLVLSNIKLPKDTSMKKCVNLKEISLNSIRGFDIKEFFEKGLTNKESLQRVTITNTDMLNMSIDFLWQFNNLKYLEINSLSNCPFTNLYFIRNNHKLLDLIINNNEIPISEINNIINFNGMRKVEISIKDCPNSKLKIDRRHYSEITFFGDKVSFFAKNINLFKISKCNIIVENGIDDFETLKLLVECKKRISFLVKGYSSLNVEQAEIIKELLEIFNIKIMENDIEEEISIDSYIQTKKQINDIIKIVNYSDGGIQKFLKVYKNLGQKIELSEKKKSENKINCAKIDVAKALQRCLQCVNVESTIIFGDDLENDEPHYWNQVKIDGKWYNVDLALDIPKIKKKKVEYCLLDDEDFDEFHTAKSGQKHYCKDEYNYKFVNVFIKTGLFKEQLLASYIEIMKAKFKKIFNSNKKDKVLALPSGDNTDGKENATQ